jgi:hypothetical protein
MAAPSVTGASATGLSATKPRSTSGSIQGLGYLLTALRCQGLTRDKLVLQLTTFARSHNLFLELSVRTPRTFTANQVRQGGKEDTNGRELSRTHFSALHCLHGCGAFGPKINYFFNVEIIFGARQRLK